MATQKNIEKTDDEKGMHDGHRGRLLDLVYGAGLDTVSTIQALEFILCYIFPRGDVNPLAHRLLNRFGNVSTIMEAELEDLKEVKGMGEKAAKKLKSLLDIFFFYSFDKLTNAKNLQTLGEFFDYIEQIFRPLDHEELYMFGITKNGVMTHARKFGRGTNAMVGFNIRDVILYLSTYKVDNVILVHNHPNGSCVASKQDVLTYQKLKEAFIFTGGTLSDMVIVGNDGIYSMENSKYLRIFSIGEEYTQSLNMLGCPSEKKEKQPK